MPKFRKKPVVIEAVQFNGDAESAALVEDTLLSDEQINHEVVRWRWRDISGSGGHFSDIVEYLEIDTLEGVMRALPGDWIIRGVNGELYPCKPDIFEKTYEAVGNDER